jgi:hypothetical protein
MIPPLELLARKLVSSFRRKGLVGTLKSFVVEIEDIYFDRRFGVHTLETTRDHDLPTGPCGISPTKIKRLRKMLTELQISYRDFVFLDLGSGKGRALLIASEFPFKRIIGVEILPELHSLAGKNIGAYRSATQKCSAIELHCCNATLYRMPPENTVLFLSNPFGSPVLSQLLTSLKESLQNHPRQVYLVYHNPFCHDLIVQSGVLEVVHVAELYAVFKNRMPAVRVPDDRGQPPRDNENRTPGDIRTRVMS